MKGIYLSTDNELEVRDFARPLHKTIGEAVGGYIEVVHPIGLESPFCMIVNESGLLMELPLNRTGSLLYGTQIHGSPIVGNIVFMKEGYTPEGRDILGLEDTEIDQLKERLRSIFRS